MENDITAVCISRQTESWQIPEIPFLCFVDNWLPFGRQKSMDRVAYLAERRNLAVARALSLYPSTRHVLMIDSYYLDQPGQVRILLSEYDGRSILGGAVWFLDKTKLIPRVRFWDSWTTPELKEIEFPPKMKGKVPVRSVGSCYLYPKGIWEQVGYGVPEDLHGCEHNYLCERSGLEVYLTLDANFWRQPLVYSWPKRIRQTIHVGRLRRTSSNVCGSS
jgi:hypothetical protein